MSDLMPCYGERTPPYTVVGGDGTRVETEEFGQQLDAMAGYWYNVLGANNEELMAIKRDGDIAGTPNHLYEQNTNPHAEHLASKLTDLIDTPNDALFVIYGCSGSMACENARKEAVKYHKAKGHARDELVFGAIRGGYHGSIEAQLDIIDPERNELVIRSPCYKSEEGIGEVVQSFEEQVKEIESDGRKVGGFFYEPVMGVRGAVELPESYIEPISQICRERDILLIADEVTTGMGRTGAWFASEHTGIEPDIMTLGKGFTGGYYPTSATVLDEKIVDALETLEEEGESYKKLHRRGNGLAGTPEGSALALQVIEILERDDERLLTEVREKGEYAFQRLQELESLEAVREVRGKGLLQAVDVRDSTLAGKVQEAMRDRGVNQLPEGRMIMFAPPYTIKREEIDTFVETTGSALETLQ